MYFTIHSCVEVLVNTYVTNIECLVLLQKKVVRLLRGAKRLDHTSRLFYNLHILKVPDIVELNIGIIMFKAYHNLLSTLECSSFKKNYKDKIFNSYVSDM